MPLALTLDSTAIRSELGGACQNNPENKVEHQFRCSWKANELPIETNSIETEVRFAELLEIPQESLFCKSIILLHCPQRIKQIQSFQPSRCKIALEQQNTETQFMSFGVCNVSDLS